VDVLSHALIIVILFLAAGIATSLLPFAIIGAVIIDADILFGAISDRSPALYIFTHGGFSHSIVGSVFISGLAIAGIQLAFLAGAIPAGNLTVAPATAFFVILAGALIHLGIDALAYPGIPLLHPVADKKVTAGILPGPSILLFITTGSIMVAWIAGWVSTSLSLGIALAIIILFLGFRIILFLVIHIRQPGRRCVPLPNPLQWIILDEDETSVSATRFSLLHGASGHESFAKYINTNPSETGPFLKRPELRRLKFNSYTTVAEKTRSEFIFSDPLREHGYFRYPFGYRRWVIPITTTPDHRKE
jgi:inner membrane protein